MVVVSFPLPFHRSNCIWTLFPLCILCRHFHLHLHTITFTLIFTFTWWSIWSWSGKKRKQSEINHSGLEVIFWTIFVKSIIKSIKFANDCVDHLCKNQPSLEMIVWAIFVKSIKFRQKGESEEADHGSLQKAYKILKAHIFNQIMKTKSGNRRVIVWTIFRKQFN